MNENLLHLRGETLPTPWGFINNFFQLLEKHGPHLGIPHTKKLAGRLYELRIRGKQEIRIIYGFVRNKIYLLHGFKKQTQKTPQKEIETALNRYRFLTAI